MVNWSGHALSQLRCIHDLIAQDSPFYAKRVTEAPEIRPAGIAVLAVIHKRQNLQEEDVPRTP